MKRWGLGGVLVVLPMLVFAYTGSMVRSCGLKWVADCPEKTLSPTEAQALYERGLATTEEDMMGEYYRTSSVKAGLPMLREAALHGNLSAMQAYGGHFIRRGAIDMDSIDGLSYSDATAEGMMWSILRKHRGEAIMEGDEETYRVLLDPAIPFPDELFDSPSGTAWMFQMLTESGLSWAREQAYAWRACW